MKFHLYYKQLTDWEKLFVDDQFRAMIREAKIAGVKLDNCDKAEIAVDAISKWIIESRNI
jgi:hypothetical protein